MKKESILIGILGLLLLAISSKAQIPMSSQCINESYLFTYQDLYVSGTLIETNITTYCPSGCIANATQYGDDCRMQTQGGGFDYTLIPILGFGIIAFIFMYFAMNVSKEHAVLQILFTSFSWFFIWGTMGAIQTTMDINGIVTYNELVGGLLQVVIWGGVVYIFYLILNLLKGILGQVSARRERKKLEPFGSLTR